MYITIELESREGRIMYMPSCSNCTISLHVCTQAIESNSNFTSIRLGFLSAGTERFYTTSALPCPCCCSYDISLTCFSCLHSCTVEWIQTSVPYTCPVVILLQGIERAGSSQMYQKCNNRPTWRHNVALVHQWHIIYNNCPLLTINTLTDMKMISVACASLDHCIRICS